MNPIKKIKESKSQQKQTQDSPSVWNSAGRLRTTNWEADTETRNELNPVGHSGPKVDRIVPTVEKLNNGSTKHRPKQTGPTEDRLSTPLVRVRVPLKARAVENVLAPDSPKRVDFSRAHQLREVNWDGTYQDRFTIPLNSESSDNTPTYNPIITNSQDSAHFSRSHPDYALFSRNIDSSNFSLNQQDSFNFSRNQQQNSTNFSRNPKQDSFDFSKNQQDSSKFLRNQKHDSFDFSRNKQQDIYNFSKNDQDSLHFIQNQQDGSNFSRNQQDSSKLPRNQQDSIHFSRIPADTITATSTSPTPSPTTATLTFNNGLRFTSPPYAPPPSISNSVTDFHLISPPSSASQPSSASSSPTSSSLILTQQQPPDIRWAEVHNKHIKEPLSYSAKTNNNGRTLRPTGLNNIHTSNPKINQPISCMSDQLQLHQKNSKNLPQATTRRQVDFRPHSQPQATLDRSRGDRIPRGVQSRGISMEIDSSSAEVSHRADDVELSITKFPLQFKMPITTDVQEDRIMLRLKEKLKQQRSLASSSASGSNGSSLSCSSNSNAATQLSSTLTMHMSLSGDGGHGVEKPRKIAASHTASAYRGFSEVAPLVPNSWRSTSKLGGAKKLGKPIKQPVLQTKKHEAVQGARQVALSSSPERPKKMTRLIAPGLKKPSKLGVTNIISTSSWRAGHDLVMKELNLDTNTSRNRSTRNQGNGHQAAETTKNMTDTTTDQGHGQLPTDIASLGANQGGSDKDKTVEEALAHARVLSKDARNVLNEISQGSQEEIPYKSPSRLAQKRKASKPIEPEKQQQSNAKTRHYDQDSIRKFMAKQRADRLRKQTEEKMAKQQAHERKQQILQNLTEKQKQVAKLAAVTKAPDGEKKVRNHENLELSKLDQDDNSTLTDDTGESTPRVVQREAEQFQGRQRHNSKGSDIGVNTNQHALNVTTSTPTATRGSAVKLVEFRGHTMALDVDSIVNQFSQVIKHRQIQDPNPAASSTTTERSGITNLSEFQLQGTGAISGTRARNNDNTEVAFTLGTSNSVVRTNEERKLAIKATALTLQNRLAEEREKMKGVMDNSPGWHGSDFMSRHMRVAGDYRDFAVFTSDLPGANSTHRQLDKAATQIQAAYRGHNVRRALDWELPNGQTFGHNLITLQQNKQKSHLSNADEYDDDDDDDDNETTERDSSTFSEITYTEEDTVDPDRVSLWNQPGHGGRQGTHQASVYGKALKAGYKPATPSAWEDAKPDPYSVMSVFTRQSRYLAAGSRHADMPYSSTITTTTSTTTAVITTSSMSNTPAYGTSFNLTSLKQPVSRAHEQTPTSQPIVARARYTRVETVICETANDDANKERAKSSEMSKSEYSTGVRSRHSKADRSALVISSEDDMSAGSSPTRGLAGVSRTSGNRYDDDDDFMDIGLSHWSKDSGRINKSQPTPRNKSEPKPTSDSKSRLSAAVSVQHQSEPLGRLSPNSLANKLSANLTYLESMEESLRHVIGVERTRSVALAQQETVSLAQILKSRQIEQDLLLQGKTHRELIDTSAQELDTMRSKREGTQKSAAPLLLEHEANLRPESRSYSMSSASKSNDRSVEQKRVHSAGGKQDKSSSTATASPSIAAGSSYSRTAREDSYTSIKTDENLRNDLSTSSRSASQSGSIPEEVAEEDSYSVSFDESFSEVLPSESHRKTVRRQSDEHQHTNAQSDNPSHKTSYGDLTSLFSGENNFDKFTADMVHQIMREEEYRAKHQAALLSLREKALKEKAKADLAWLQQMKQKPLNKAADDVYPNWDKRERIIRRNLEEQQAEIRRLQETNKITSRERQMLLQQHEEIVKLKQNTQQTLQKINGKSSKEKKMAHRSDIHTEDEMDRASEISEEVKDSKSDSEVYRDTSPSRHHKRAGKNIQKHQKLRLDEKYMTAREHKLHERQKHAKELLEWKKRLDAEEEKVFKLEKKAIEAWEGKKKKEKTKDVIVVKKASKPVSSSRKDDSHVVSNVMLSSMRDEMDGPVAVEVTSTVLKTSISEAISAQISGSKTDTAIDTISSLEVKNLLKQPPDGVQKEKGLPSRVIHNETSPQAVKGKEESSLVVGTNSVSPKTSGSEGSIPEEIPTGVSGDKQTVDSSDDTLINSSVNDEYMDTFEPEASSTLASRKKSPVGRLLLPTPWSHRTGSESESEDSTISHTETVSDVSDYEVRIRQLSDELRRRRKEIELLKKERSRRQKEKLKAQEEAMQKQLDVYNRYIQQLKVDKDELEHDVQLKTAVKPQIKQPRVGNHVKLKQTGHGDEAGTSLDDSREGMDTSGMSPSADGKGAVLSPGTIASPSIEKDRKKVSLKLIDKLLETSETKVDKPSPPVESKPTLFVDVKSSLSVDAKPSLPNEVKHSKKPDSVSEKTISSVIDENIDDLSLSESVSTDKNFSLLKIQSSPPATPKKDSSEPAKEIFKTISETVTSKTPNLTTKSVSSYVIDFSSSRPTMTSERKEVSTARNEKITNKESSANEISEYIEDQQSSVSSSVKSGTKTSIKEVVPGLVSIGIQESDSETESRINSYQTSVKSEGSSRPSSERSLGSISYSPGDDEEEDDDDIISYGSDKMPPRPQNVPRGIVSTNTDDNISEHISGSLPSISEKRQTQSALMSHESKEILDSFLDYKGNDLKNEDNEDDKTPVQTPCEMISTPIPEDLEEQSLLATDPLADFSLGDRVLVAGRCLGFLRYKGKVDFSPGIWAGVELDNNEGDCDGMHQGKRYFTCQAGHGLMVTGCDISTVDEHLDISEIKDVESQEESLATDHEVSKSEDILDLVRASLSASNSSQATSPNFKSTAMEKSPVKTYASSTKTVLSPEKTILSPAKTIPSPVKKDITVIADNIVDHLTTSLLEDCVTTFKTIVSKKTASSASVHSKSTSEPSTRSSSDLTITGSLNQEKLSPYLATDKAADIVMKSMLEEAISDILRVKTHKSTSAHMFIHELISNGSASTESLDRSTRSLLDENEDYKIQDNDSGLSMDAVQRPGSPVPGGSPTAKDHKLLNDDLAELFGEYIDDDLEFEPATISSKPPPPYPAERSAPPPEVVTPLVPHTKEEITPIISRAVEIYWEKRRYGESLQEVSIPPDFLSDVDNKETNPLTSQSLSSWKLMLFNLTGEIIQEIYKSDDKLDTPVWQKTKHKSQKFFHGINPPTTCESLQPIVQAAVCKFLGLNGNRKYNPINKWNIRKKKDLVDSILVQELGEEEAGWVNYDDDELSLKMSLTDSLFDSLVVDTVHTLNGIYQKKQHSEV